LFLAILIASFLRASIGSHPTSRWFVLLVNGAKPSQLACRNINALERSSPSQNGTEIDYT
jgi:hypothetical protein